MYNKVIQYLCIAVAISCVGATISPMTVSVPMTDIQIPVVPFFKLKPLPFMECVGYYKCDGVAKRFKSWLKTDDKDNSAMFTYSNPKDVSNFLHTLAREEGGIEVIEFDYRQEPGDKERKRVAFKRAQEVYDATGKPAIVHAYHSRTVSEEEENKLEFPPAFHRDGQVLELLKECGDYQSKTWKRFDIDYENRPCIVVYTTEDSSWGFSLDVRRRISMKLQIENEYVYWPRMCYLPGKIEEIQRYNEAAYYINGLLTGGLVTSTAVSLYLAIKFLKSSKKDIL